MKKLISCLLVAIIIGAVLVLSSFTNSQNEINNDLFRIHIIANSNSEIDSSIKYKIKDAYANFLTAGLANCKDKKEAENLIKNNIDNLKAIANTIISECGLNYGATLNVANEYFPSRVYGDYVVESGYYDGITVTLGQGRGDNWWCVLFPPLCYYNATITNSNSVVYKSKLLEIINQFYNLN